MIVLFCMGDWYAHLPDRIDPVAFSIGLFEVRWYSLMYLAGFFVFWILTVIRVRRKEGNFFLSDLWDISLAGFFGAILGGRVGFFFLYEDLNQISFRGIFSPWEAETGAWSGWYGMSAFGAIAGGVLLSFLVVSWKKISFWRVADFLAPAIPLGYAFGRLGNFLNNELFGRETNTLFGMIVEGKKRHPVQIYEMVLEGIVLFGILWAMRNRKMTSGSMVLFLGIGYGTMRFFTEFFRDEVVFLLGMTQGQWYSLILCTVCISSFLWKRKKKYVTMS